MKYYSAKLLFIILVEKEKTRKKNLYNESVIVFKARDFSQAFEKALQIGKAQEKTYRNSKEQDVKWSLVEITNLDVIGSKIDGVEVASKLYHRVSDSSISFNQQFTPELSKPNQSF